MENFLTSASEISTHILCLNPMPLTEVSHAASVLLERQLVINMPGKWLYKY